MNRKIWIVVAAIVAAILIFVIVLGPSFVDANRYRPQIEKKLSEQLGRPVHLGSMRVTFVPPAFRAENAVIGDAPGFDAGRPFAEAQTLYLRPKFFPLLRGEVEISKLELVQPHVEFVRNREGVWNFATLGGQKSQDGKTISIGDMEVRDGRIAVEDLKQKTPRSVYDHINLAVRGFAPDKNFSLDGSVQIPGPGKEAVAFHGQAGPIARAELLRTPVDGRVELNQASLADLQRALKIQMLSNSDALLTGKIQIHNKDGAFVSDGSLQAANPRIRGVNLGYPVTVDYGVAGDLTRRTYDIRKGELRLGKTPLSVKGQVRAEQSPPIVDLQLHTSKASLGEAARLAAALGIALNPNTQISGVLNANVHASGPFDKVSMQGEASAENVRMSGGDLKQPVGIQVVALSLSPSEIRSNEFTAKTGNTDVRAQFTVDGYASQTPTITAHLAAPDAQIPELLNIAHAYGISAVQGMTGTGAAGFDLTITGPIHNTAALQYKGTASVRNGVFNVSSLGKPLAVKTADVRFNGNSAVLNNLEAAIGNTAARGTLSIQNPAAPQVEFSLSADKIDLRDWQNLVQPANGNAPAPNARPTGLLERTTGNGRLSINTVVYDQLTLQNVQTAVRLNKGVITMNPFTAGMYGGQSSGSVVLDMRQQPVAYTADLKLQGVDANRLTSSISSVHEAIYGNLAADSNVRFSGAGAPANIAHTLNGRVSIDLSNGAIGHMDLLHELGAIAQFVTTGRPEEPDTKVSHMTGAFEIRDGVATTNDLKAVMPAGSMAATGSVDLAQQTLNMHVTAVLSKSYSQMVGGTGIGGLLSTAVANQNGELVIPVIVSGTFQHPQFTPDVAAVAQMRLHQLAPSTDNPGQFAVGILEQILGGKTPPPAGDNRAKPQQPQPQPQQPQNDLPGILNRILKNAH